MRTLTIEILNQMNFTRLYTLGRLEKTIDAEWDTQPTGFSNTIRWNAGHIYVTLEYFVHLVDKEYEIVNAEWIPLFVRGSSPAIWEGDIPSNEEMVVALTEQTARLKEVLSGKIEEPLENPIDFGNHTIKTIGALILFAIWHEGLHTGIIDGLNRATVN
ncbi:DinB family protein [Sporosarcina sp. Marseille-Q4063]|uniref:DinB family protein n=1 Tax=Sporosarcina sp. Marseille-Q4063 TaxID=2810514 RepID=UPI001BAF7467|nr:DinB family protein [Sporosarcina sp. Marseille-Q4063]QUW20985.1 DinB family protein [Sporosarcina sp. Marseille-Q4063]